VHDSDITGVSFEIAEPIDEGAFNIWMGKLLAEQGQHLLRTKGISDACARSPARAAAAGIAPPEPLG